MTSNVMVIKAPPIEFSKKDLYRNYAKFKELGPYIKAIPDAFFLSNDFRHDHILHFSTYIASEPYVISFYGKQLKYLGPSFFSAAHLLIRAQLNVVRPNSREGKLTPGLEVRKGTFKEIFAEEYKDNYKWYNILSKAEKLLPIRQKRTEPLVLLFGFQRKELKGLDTTNISFGLLDIDEQVIIANYYLFDREVEKNEPSGNIA